MGERTVPIKLREEILGLRDKIRDVLDNLRAFVETEDYSFIERVQQLCEGLDGKKFPGLDDLGNNIRSIYLAYKQTAGKFDTDTHAHLVSQAVYAIVKANILLTGLEFKVKRMRGF